MLLHSDTNNFNNDVINSKHLVLVDFLLLGVDLVKC